MKIQQLFEETSEFETDRDKIENILYVMGGGNGRLIRQYSVLKNGKVNALYQHESFNWYASDAKLLNLSDKKLPFRFQTCNDGFSINSHTLEDATGFPVNCKNFAVHCNELKTLAGVKAKYENTLTIFCPKLERFDCEVKTYRLKLSQIKSLDIDDLAKSFPDLKFVTFSETCWLTLYNKRLLKFVQYGILPILLRTNLLALSEPFQEVQAVCNIIKKHCDSGDIFAAKEELINAGYKEYAKL